MDSNKHDKAVLYARVSTEEQAKSGYSLAQQIAALRAYASREGYEVLEEVVDRAQSGASLERPGMDRVRDLVAGGGVSVVLAQDRDRFAREPALHYLLRREFEARGCLLRALNDRGDGSPEGELTDGILDQLAKFERAKIAERSRRGKLRKAQEGKIVAGHTPNFGFRYNASRDGYKVHEETMGLVARIFRMVGVEGVSTHSVTKILEAEGVPSPSGRRYWNKRIVKKIILDDVYKPHAFEEIADLVAPEVAARLDPEKRYGVWWFNRRRTTAKQVSESGPDGRTYRRRSRVSFKDRSEWIAVPVPDSGVPAEWVEAARAVVAEYRSSSKLGGRSWELSGALMRCGECGRAMEPVDRYYRTKSGGKGVICYYRCREGNRRRQTCANGKSIRFDKAHPAVWDLVSGLLSDPRRLREGLEAAIEEQRRALRGGDPECEEKAWLEKLDSLGRKRSGYLDLAAEGIMGRDELRAKLAEIQEARETVEEELAVLKGRRERIERMERDRDAVMETYADAVPDTLDALTPEERHRVYKMLRLEVLAYPDKSLRVSGAIVGGVGTDPRDYGGANRRDRELGALEPTQTVISPPPDEFFSETNDNSVGILLTFGTARVLLAGDAEKKGEEYMSSGPHTGPLTLDRVREYTTA